MFVIKCTDIAYHTVNRDVNPLWSDLASIPFLAVGLHLTNTSIRNIYICNQVELKLKRNIVHKKLNKPIESDAGSTISSGAGPGIADGLNYTGNEFDTEN